MASSFSFESGRYEVAVGVRPTSGPFFVCDRELPRYRAAKAASGASTIARDCPDDVCQLVWRFVSEQVHASYAMKLPAEYRPGAFESLGGRIAEDYAIVRADSDREWAALLDVRLPSGWAPEEKIGLSFAQVHAPVPGMAKINRAGPSVIDMMIHAKPMERFVWGVQFDDALDKHPRRAQAVPFDPANPRLVVRYERQMTVGFPAVQAALFIIRLTLHPLDSLTHAQRIALAAALESMSPEQRHYKGVARSFDSIVRHIKTA